MVFARHELYYAPLGRLDVFGTWPFLSLPFREGHSLAFLEVVEARPFDARIVEEQIFVRSCVDKSKAFFRQFLNRTFSHFIQLSKKFSAALPKTNVFGPVHHRPELYRKDWLLQGAAGSREDHGASFVFGAVNFSLVPQAYHASFSDKCPKKPWFLDTSPCYALCCSIPHDRSPKLPCQNHSPENS